MHREDSTVGKPLIATEAHLSWPFVHFKLEGQTQRQSEESRKREREREREKGVHVYYLDWQQLATH